MTEALHHYHKRRRIYKKHEPYPHPDKAKRMVDKMVYIMGIFAVVMTIPQVLTIWVSRNAGGVSAVSWASYLIAAAFWLLYGVMHREKPIIFNYTVWIVLEILIIYGVLLYG
jgi:uncharacterized protein with PQ loop repeat